MSDQEERLSRIAAKAEAYVSAQLFAGIEWSVRHQKKDFAAGTAGFCDTGLSQPLEADGLYRIYSMTKPVVSIMALILVERGLLRLFDPISTYLPAFAKTAVLGPDGQQVRRELPIMVEHLLTHRAGLSYDFVPDCPVGALCRDAHLCDDGARSLEDLVDCLASFPLAYQPGERWQYSFATDVLALIIEKVTDRPLGDCLDEELFKPLGMSNTGFAVAEGQEHRLLPLYGSENLADVLEFAAQPQSLSARPDPALVEQIYPSAPGSGFRRGGHGLFSTAADYIRFAEFLLDGRTATGQRLLSPMMVEMMWQNRIPASQRPLRLGPIVYGGYGWNLFGRVMIDSGQSLCLTAPGEGGWLGAASTSFWVDRQNQFVGVVMAQYIGSALGLDKDMQTAAYQALA